MINTISNAFPNNFFSSMLKSINKPVAFMPKQSEKAVELSRCIEPTQLLSFVNHGFDLGQDVGNKIQQYDPCAEPAVVLYNPFSIDSLFACAILASLPRSNLKFVPYSQLADLPTIPKGTESPCKLVFAVGVELSQAHLQKFAEAPLVHDTKLVLFGYRDSYEWLTAKAAKKIKANQSIVFFKPSDYWYGELIHRTDNTAIQLVRGFLNVLSASYGTYAEADPKNLSSITAEVPAGIMATAVLASRLVSLSFPIAPMDVPIGNWYETFSKEAKTASILAGKKPDMPETPTQEMVAKWHEQESRNIAQIYNMLPMVRKLLGMHNKPEEAKKIPVITGQLMYSAMESDARAIISNSLIIDELHSLPMIAIHEINHTMILSIIAKGHDAVITYEDKRGCRVWRIYAKDAARAKSIAGRFDHRSKWSEGMCLCVVTDLPSVTLKHK